MSFDPEEYENQRMLETIAGERCPCGHHRRSHEPAGEFPGEQFGECKVLECDCKGLIDARDDAPLGPVEMEIEAYDG